MDTNQIMETGGAGKWMWVVLLVIVLVIGIGAWWYVSHQELLPAVNNQETGALPPAVDADVQALKMQSSSDDVASIDADLKATNLNNLDKELGDISNTVNQ